MAGAKDNQPFACKQGKAYRVCVIPYVFTAGGSSEVIAIMGPCDATRTSVKNIFELKTGSLVYPDGLDRKSCNPKKILEWFQETHPAV